MLLSKEGGWPVSLLLERIQKSQLGTKNHREKYERKRPRLPIGRAEENTKEEEESGVSIVLARISILYTTDKGTLSLL